MTRFYFGKQNEVQDGVEAKTKRSGVDGSGIKKKIPLTTSTWRLCWRWWWSSSYSSYYLATVFVSKWHRMGYSLRISFEADIFQKQIWYVTDFHSFGNAVQNIIQTLNMIQADWVHLVSFCKAHVLVPFIRSSNASQDRLIQAYWNRGNTSFNSLGNYPCLFIGLRFNMYLNSTIAHFMIFIKSMSFRCVLRNTCKSAPFVINY